MTSGRKASLTGWFADPAVRDSLPPLLTAAQAAGLLGIAVQTLHHWSSRGRLAGRTARPGRRLVLSRDCLIATFLAGGRA